MKEEKIYLPLEEGLSEVKLMKDITILEIVICKTVSDE